MGAHLLKVVSYTLPCTVESFIPLDVLKNRSGNLARGPSTNAVRGGILMADLRYTAAATIPLVRNKITQLGCTRKRRNDRYMTKCKERTW